MKNDIVKRTLSGIVLVAVLVFGVLYSPYSKLLVVSLIAVGSLYEFLKHSRLLGARPLFIAATFLALLFIEVAFLTTIGRGSMSALLFVLLFVFVRGVVELYRKHDKQFVTLGMETFGVLYTTVPMALLLFLPGEIVLMLLIAVWMNDVGAFLVGITLGKHKLFERISPKKSWEGFFGGLLCATLFGAGVGYWYYEDTVLWAGLGFVVSLASVYGDLFESMFKRSVGIKDSGSIIPGHGGFLDRFDALLFATPFFFVLYKLFA